MAEFEEAAKAVGQGSEALKSTFCEMGITSAKMQSVFLKALNGCSNDPDGKCGPQNGLPPVKLFEGSKLITDPNVTGSTLTWDTPAGKQRFNASDSNCKPPTS